MKIFARLLALISFLMGVICSMLILFLMISTLIDYRPSKIMDLEILNHTSENQISNRKLSVLSWNIGYAGLGKEMDFFYDGGKQVRPSKSLNQFYLNSILGYLDQNKNVDFLLLQEVDRRSKRSYFTDQVATISKKLSNHSNVFAPNYKVPFVPVPPSKPMGKVFSGLMNLSAYDPVISERRSFPGNYAWPKSLFMLDRCFLVQRFKTSRGKELVLVNTHNSAFDDGQLREEQMQILREFALSEYQKGNYVIIGGDWNQNPPGFSEKAISNGDIAEKNDLGAIAGDFMPSTWSWAYDELIPTNRFVNEIYTKGNTPVTLIDFFLLSPNIKINSVKTTDLGFVASDHNPVLLKFELEP